MINNMKKKVLYLIFLALFLFSCSKKETVVNKMSEREYSFDPSIKFEYAGSDKYLKAITDDLVEYSSQMFGDQGAVEIPVPGIVKIEDSDKNDIKVYGDFWIYGYEMFGTIFNTKNGASLPGCYHLKDENGNVLVLSRLIAEDGSNNWESLVEICSNDEELAKQIFAENHEKVEPLRIEYAKMYAKKNNLKLSGIKDYGWPVILFDDITDTEFIYNFYSAYFDEVTQEDYLKDMVDRLNNLKSKYMTKDLIEKIDDMTAEVGADMVINAQDVTEQMRDTLQVKDMGKGELVVSMENGTEDNTNIKVKLGKVDGKRVIVDMNY